MMRQALLVVWCSLLAPLQVMAQGTAPDALGRGPLGPIADLARILPVAPALPMLLTAPAPKVGVHWSAGNPAGLAFELNHEWSAFGASHGSESGDFRRPLDAGEVDVSGLSGIGWRRIGSGAVSGGVEVVRTALGGNAFANTRAPYTSSPHTSADTAGADVRELAVRVEGAGGWRVGAWGFGIAAGYETTDGRTDESFTPKFRRTTLLGATLGVARTFADEVVILGAHARVNDGSSRLSVQGRGDAIARVYPLEGYTEPVPILLTGNNAFNRRIESTAYAFGASASLRVLGTRWVLWSELTDRTETQTSEVVRGAPEDRWSPSGLAAGLSAQRAFAGDRALVTANVTWTRLSGEARRAALEVEGILFEADEQDVTAMSELRLRSVGGWEGAARAFVAWEDRERIDVLEGAAMALHAWRPGFAVEVGRSKGSFAFGAGAGASLYTPVGEIPNPTAYGPIYNRILAPELALYGTPAVAYTGTLSAGWTTAGGRRLWGRLHYTSVSPRDAGVILPHEPSGTRTRWTVAVGVNLERPEP